MLGNKLQPKEIMGQQDDHHVRMVGNKLLILKEMKPTVVRGRRGRWKSVDDRNGHQ